MSDTASEKSDGGGRLESAVGVMVVLLATFLGICSVKAGNIGQAMAKKQVERNNNWAWFQARTIRSTVYECSAEELNLARPNETAEAKSAREALRKRFLDDVERQRSEREKQKTDAEQAEADYDDLAKKDDQFDLCEAALAVALALFGVTALMKKWWMFVFALLPAAVGVFMGVAGFMGQDTDLPVVKWFLDLLA
jgi:hypothetical protein